MLIKSRWSAGGCGGRRTPGPQDISPDMSATRRFGMRHRHLLLFIAIWAVTLAVGAAPTPSSTPAPARPTPARRQQAQTALSAGYSISWAPLVPPFTRAQLKQLEAREAAARMPPPPPVSGGSGSMKGGALADVPILGKQPALAPRQFTARTLGRTPKPVRRPRSSAAVWGPTQCTDPRRALHLHNMYRKAHG